MSQYRIYIDIERHDHDLLEPEDMTLELTEFGASYITDSKLEVESVAAAIHRYAQEMKT